jgi:flagellar operon protein (TIGR03826 family)
MELANCLRCGKVFAKVGRNICADCLAEEEALYRKVREYLEANPGLTVQEVAQRCQVDPKKIYDFLKAGRLEGIHFAPGSAQWQCDSCGGAITSGKLCNKCRKTLKSEVRGQEAPIFREPTPILGKTVKGKIHTSRWRDR